MRLDALNSLLDTLHPFKCLINSLNHQECMASAEILSPAIPFILVNLAQRLKVPMLVITPRPEDSIHLYGQMEMWNSITLHYSIFQKQKRCHLNI